MDRFQYQGPQPHIARIAGESGVDPVGVARNEGLRQLDSLLAQGVAHRNRGNLVAARGAFGEAARRVEELRVAHEAGRLAHADAMASLPAEDVPARDDQAPSGLPAEGEGGQEDMTGDSQDGNPGEGDHSDDDALRDTIDRMDPPPDDDPPLGRKSRRR